MGGVFDVTDFTGHPGGYGRLQMVAGQDLEPFWKIYTQHNREHIAKHLDRYRIGQLSAADAEKQRLASVFPNPYLNDPEPSPDLLTNTRYCCHVLVCPAYALTCVDQVPVQCGGAPAPAHGLLDHACRQALCSQSLQRNPPPHTHSRSCAFAYKLLVNGAQVPDISPESYCLTVSGVGLNTTTFTLDDLKRKFPKVEIASVIQARPPP